MITEEKKKKREGTWEWEVVEGVKKRDVWVYNVTLSTICFGTYYNACITSRVISSHLGL